VARIRTSRSGLSVTPHVRALTRPERARLMRAVISNVTEGIIVADRDGHLLLFNDGARRVLGLDLVPIDPSQWSAAHGCYRSEDGEIYPPSDLPLARALRGESTSEEEIFIRNENVPAGVWISLNGAPLRGRAGETIGGVVTFRDISSRKTADTERLKQEALIRRLSNAVEQTADSIFITDRSGMIEYVNPAFETMTGYVAAEVIGQTPRMLKSGKQPPGFYETLWTTILSGQVFRASTVNRTKSGAEFHAEQTITPLKAPDGAVTHFVSVIKDVTERVKRQAREIEMTYAARIQGGLYPQTSPTIPGFDIAGAVWPAKMTGGDYFDYVEMPGDAIGIVIGDVCGHGLGSALIMAVTRAYLRPLAVSNESPGAILTRLNQFLHDDLQHDRHFVTLFLARLDPSSRTLAFASAGHLPAFVLDRAGAVKATLDSNGCPLALFGTMCYPTSDSLTLDPGDVLVLLTDGVTEAEAPDGRIFGSEGALQVIGAHRGESAMAIVHHVRDAVRHFAGQATQADDVTVVICKAG
jgi:sigma-B regulation protein RsbU (phosphoserine phosphatase)